MPSACEPHSPRVYVVLLNWNGWGDTLECLESLFRSDYPDFRVIAGAMARLAADAGLRARLRARGLERAAFSWRRSARAHLALFQQALAGGRV